MSGPIVLFDKSLLQSLSTDEALWLDHFSISNICPLFYVETLADLEKSVRAGRTPEQEVGIVASKTPSLQGQPCVEYSRICYSELRGVPVPLSGRIPLANGVPVSHDDETGFAIPVSDEAEAFSRWTNNEFLDVERTYARNWRAMLSLLDLPGIADVAKKLKITDYPCKSLEQAREIAQKVMSPVGDSISQLQFLTEMLSLPKRESQEILERWFFLNSPPIEKFAPYCTHVAKVEIFFMSALAAGLISDQRPSNKVDIAYLYYLPFCMYFTSSDKLHKKCGPLFLRNDQSFIWGPNLKIALKEINEHYEKLPAETKASGIFSFARVPPMELEDNLMCKIWDKHLPKWRESADESLFEPVKNEQLGAKIENLANAPEIVVPDGFTSDDADSMVLKRKIPRQRGSWQVLHKDIKG